MLVTFAHQSAVSFSAVIRGDPQFVGLQNQQFQVHGYPGEKFNLISAPKFSVNSNFVYLQNGVCNYNNTECWTHPGTYLDVIGFLIGNNKIRAVSGSHSEGLRLFINGVLMPISQIHHPLSNTSSSNFVFYPQSDKLVVHTDLFDIELINSNYFFNLRVSLLSSQLLHLGSLVSGEHPNVPIHGLIGQTWKDVKYVEGRPYEGEIEDYMITSKNIFDPVFPFSQFHKIETVRI
jgi:hypothetical protein